MNISSSVPVTMAAELRSGTSQAEAAERQRTVHAIRALNAATMFGENRELTFTLDRSTHRMVIHVIDRDTHETVMQLPPDYILSLWASLQKKSP